MVRFIILLCFQDFYNNIVFLLPWEMSLVRPAQSQAERTLVIVLCGAWAYVCQALIQELSCMLSFNSQATFAS
jgi:hypothetical protein